MPTCPVCGGTLFTTLVPASRIDEECRERERFIRARLPRPASAEELKDLTEFFHGANADILACAGCTLLVRNEHERKPVESYSQDEYDESAIERVYPQYLEAFRRREDPYRALLPPGADVIELGSHYGAFLETAQGWGWRVSGVDIGRDTTRFARSKGLTVHHCELNECRFANASLDGVFIWNCFEQIDDPKPVLAEAWRVLKSEGLLVVRVPNALFYSVCETLLGTAELRSGATEFLTDALAYNNLLGFPYLYGHSRTTLQRLIEPFGFRCEGMLNSELITLPLPENPEWVIEEEREISAEVQMLARSVLRNRDGALLGPWIEVWFRKAISESRSADRR